jgi:hypothetical protein
MMTLREADAVRQRALQAAAAVLQQAAVHENDTINLLLARLQMTRKDLLQALGQYFLGGGQRAFSFDPMVYSEAHLRALLTQVDRIVAEQTQQMAQNLRPAYQMAAELGAAHVSEPVASLGLVARGLPGLSAPLVMAAYDNTVDLLSDAMQQFRTQIVTKIRGVALGGVGPASKTGAIAALRTAISGAGFDQAAYRAERIVRTEVSRVFQGASYDSLVATNQPALRKGWRAVNDKRTRETHSEAHDRYYSHPIALDESFQVGNVKLRFPLDPAGEGETKDLASETINCRCSLVTDVDVEQFTAAIPGRISLAMGA